ncbi:unnamed protein product [Rotaria sordida]|uniref:MAM domain-containing protein n=1 Tax=Rotaria sordida TaxID=392033 RepID=A0A814RTB7_9BILA|nr:unnamed protein product [Rotaria sordida]
MDRLLTVFGAAATQYDGGLNPGGGPTGQGYDGAIYQGGGSGFVKPTYGVDPLSALLAKARDSNFQIQFVTRQTDFDTVSSLASAPLCLVFISLPSVSFVLLNETSQQIRQPASDVTSILTSNDQGKCFFPYKINSFDMFFCLKTDPDLPATCPIEHENGPKINCSEGEYGYEKFEENQIGSRSYELESLPILSIGHHCIRLFYYFSDGNSNGTIRIILEDSQTRQNQTILTVSSYVANKWHEIRQNFQIFNSISNMFFIFERGSSNAESFYIAIDEITLIDLYCEPISTITTTPPPPTTTITAITLTSLTMPVTSTTVTSTTSSTVGNNSSVMLTTTNLANVNKSTSSVINTINSTLLTTRITTSTTVLSMNSTINIMTSISTTMNRINSTIISSTLSSSSKDRLSFKIEVSVLLVNFMLFSFRH